MEYSVVTLKPSPSRLGKQRPP